MNKHAYLIMVHDNFKILEKQLVLLDDERNDIYIHVDKKVKQFDFDHFKKMVKYSKLYYVERIDVRWGDISQIKCQFILMKNANLNYNYEYYHLISGVDMPLKTQDYIHEFFDKNKGKEYMQCTYWATPKIKRRYANYHILPKYFRCNNKILMYILDAIREILIILQKIIKYDRTRKYNIKIMYGSSWWSIDNELVKRLIQNEDMFYKMYHHTRSCDEHYIHTYVYNSEFRNRLSTEKEKDMRFVKWNKKGNLRGSPYTFRGSDYNELIHSDKLFARKFDEKTDNEIIDKIFKYLYNKQ